MNEDPYKMLTQEGGDFNGKHFNSIMELFASLGTQIVCGASTKSDTYSWHREFSKQEKKASRKKNKLERQRKKKGRK